MQAILADIYRTGLCQRGNCKSHNLLRCMRCKLVSYCSRECQRKDWIIHKEVCHTSLPLRLKGVYRVRRDYADYVCVNISYCANSVNLLNETHYVSAFGAQKQGWCCAVCGTKVYDMPRDHQVSFETGGHRLDYFRCNECCTTEKVICETSFEETGACLLNNYGKVLLFTTFAKTTLIPDLIELVLRLFISLGCSHKALYSCNQKQQQHVS